MVKPTTSKLHYKMYKKGKFWIFAGVITAALTLGTANQSAQAATTADTADQAATTDESAVPAKTVTLKSATSSAATSSSPVATQTSESGTPTASTADSSTVTSTPATTPTTSADTTTDDTTPTTSADTTTDDTTADTPTTTDATDKSTPDVTDAAATTPAEQDTATDETTDVTTPSEAASSTPVKDAEAEETTTAAEKAPATTPAADTNKAPAATPSETVPESEKAPQSAATSQTTTDLKAAARTVAAPAAMMLRAAAPAVSETIDDWMPNKTLQQWVLKALNSSETAKAAGKTWTSVDQITQEDMLYLTEFDATRYGNMYIDGKSSFSLAGLQYATNLTKLNLLTDLNQSPFLLHGDITDITPLSALTKLQFLQLSGNRITDITPITGLKNITYLSLVQNSIADFSSLDPKQYTAGLGLGEQQVYNSQLAYVPTTGKIVMVNPVKPPKGMGLTMTSPNGIVFVLTVPNYPDSAIRIFWNGGEVNAATLNADGTAINYQIIRNQIMPGQTYNPLEANYPVLILEDYTYFLNTMFSFTDSSGNTSVGSAVAMATPYVIANAAQDITVNYVDQDGNALADSETLSGLVGQPYTTAAKDIFGYVLTETPANATGRFTDEAQTITYVYREQTSSVTVNYQDRDGKTIADSETLTGQVGKAYTAVAKDILGYKLAETPTNATGKFTDEDQTVTFVYDESISSVTVNYQDKDGNELAPSETLSGQVGKDYEAKAKDILGYKLTETPANATGKFTDKIQTVTFVYDEAISSVTIHYQDKDGNELAPSETLSGQVGKDYEAKAKDILGYKLTETPANAAGKFTDESQTVTFVYDEAISSVTVNYQDKNGNELAPSETLSGQVGKDYEAKAKDILGYKLTETPANATGKFTDEAQTVTFVYDEAISSVTVHYQDKDGNELAPSETLSGQVGKDYEAAAKDILGYKLTETPANATGKFTDEAQTVTFVYDEAISSVTVHYQDKDGNELAPSETLSGQVGKAYEANAKTISGYTLTETPANATGQFTDEAQTVLFVYAKDAVTPPIVPPIQQVTVTVKHQTADGQTVAPDEVLTGQKGDTYTTAPATITGYRLVKTPANATGTFNTDETVVYVYEPTDIETGGSGDLGTPEPNLPDQPEPETPAPETPQKQPQPDTVHGGQADRVTATSVTTKPAGPVTAKQVTAQAATTVTPTASKVVADTDQTTASQLPQTDEHVTSGWWGLLLLALTGGLVGRFRKHEK